MSQIKREPAVRVSANELSIADYHFKETDDEMAPQYLLLPSGGKANRVLLVGTLMSVEDVGTDSEYWKAEIQDATGRALVFAGEYSPEAAAKLREFESDPDIPPEFVAVVGKTKEFRPEDEEDEVVVYVSPESISVISREQRDQFYSQVAQQTLDRLRSTESDSKVPEARERYAEEQDDLVDAVEEIVQKLE